MTPQVEAQIGVALRGLLNDNGLSHVKIVGYEVNRFPISPITLTAFLQHNWDTAGQYPVQLVSHLLYIELVLLSACRCKLLEIPLLVSHSIVMPDLSLIRTRSRVHSPKRYYLI